MPTKTYVLLPCMDANAPVYQQLPDGKRVQIKKIPVHRPTLRQTFMKDNKAVTIRYKANSNTIYQDIQIKEEKIEANEPFTQREFRDPEFRFGVNVVPEQKKNLQDYLEAHPEFEGFTGLCDDVSQPRYKLLDEEGDDEMKNADTLKRIKAANKVAGMTNLGELQAMLIRLNGSFFQTPKKVFQCQNLLWDFIDDHEGKALDDVLKDEENIDEKTSILIGKLMNADKLSFDAVQGKISKRGKGGEWITVREMSAEYPLTERMRLFSDFLNTADGKPLKNDLENDLGDSDEGFGFGDGEETEGKKKMGRPPSKK